MGSSKDERQTRRAVLTGAAVGVAAAAVGQSQEARAADGDPVLIGEVNDAQSGTTIRNEAGGANTNVILAGATYGIAANSHVQGGEGVFGSVSNLSGRAVRGKTSGHWSQAGVEGDASEGNGEGYGVRGKTKNGAALYGEASGPGGAGLQVIGPALFSRSGLVAFNAGQASKTISNKALTNTSFVLATIQGDVAGTYVRGVSLERQQRRFTIRLNKGAPKRLIVGWFIVN